MGSTEDDKFHLGCVDHEAPVQCDKVRGVVSKLSECGDQSQRLICAGLIAQQEKEGDLDQHLNSSCLSTTGRSGRVCERDGEGAQSQEPLIF